MRFEHGSSMVEAIKAGSQLAETGFQPGLNPVDAWKNLVNQRLKSMASCG
jgi:hypothetical protein